MKRHLVILVFGSVVNLILYQHTWAQQQLAQDAYAIFEASCLNCHGPDGAFRETLLMEHSELIDGGTVVPGNPDASELYKRLLGPTENGVQMPFGQEPLSAQSIDTVRRWILAGAPDWSATTTTLRRFITPRDVLTSIESHLNSLSSFDRPFARYFTMTHLYNSGITPEILAEYRKALSKLINSLSWRLKITNPQPIDPQETIFYIDLRHYEWDRNDGWTKIEQEYPYHITFDAPAHLALRNQLGRLQTSTKTDVPSVHIDWFVATASAPPLYDDLLSLPSSVQELETRLEVDVARNLRDAPGIEVWRAGLKNSGVSNHNRVVERHTSRYGAYWKSYDFAGSVGTRDIIVHPFNFTHDGGEIIFNLPNGLQGYYLVDGNGIQLDEAPISIVSNPAASDPTVRNGISCIGCHTEGMKTFEDEVRSAIEGNANPPYDKAHALRLYVEKSVMDALVAEDMEKYRVALEATGGTFSGVEPVSRFHEAFHGPIGAAYAAAVVGLQTETFLERVRENTGLQNVGLLALDNPNGSVKRDTWTSNFQDIVEALDYPRQVEDVPVDTQPDIIPGRPVNVPDVNLKTLLEEILEVSRLTADAMSKLTKLSNRDRDIDISDFTGLEFAINLKEIWLEDSSVSDLSPISKCTNLTHLFLWEVPVVDLKPLVNLKKLKFLKHKHPGIKDLSPLAELPNLEHLIIYIAQGISDISVVSNLTQLKTLRVRHAEVYDLTPIAGLVNLENINFHDNKITDISPIGNLTKLTEAELNSNKISDVSPLRGLTNLRILKLDGNSISDITPLLELVQLEHLEIDDNNISDITPIPDLLARLETLIWRNNPGYPKQGAMIEAPWLWIYMSGNDSRLAFNFEIDFLAWVSEGEVTEIGVATHGATEGKVINDEYVWTKHELPISMEDNIKTMMGNKSLRGIAYGNILIYSPKQQKTWFFSHTHQRAKIWLNGKLVSARDYHMSEDRTRVEFIPVTLKQGKNVLLVAVDLNDRQLSGAVFGFAEGTEYAVNDPAVSYSLSKSPVHVDDMFILNTLAWNVFDLAGWQFDIHFDPVLLEAVDVSEGDFLKTDSGATFFQGGNIDNAVGKITGLIAGRISEGGVSGSGSVLQVRFKAKSQGETKLVLQNFLFASATEESIPAGPLEIHLTVEERLLTGDVNRDGVVNILDLLRVARQLGQRVGTDSPVDVNGDGIVNIFDLTLVAQGIAGAAAPAVATGRADAATVESWIALARLEDDGSIAFRQGIANLENLLASLIIPRETALHANFPNPFNPETWIPYQLAAPSEVVLTIYDMNGGVVRRLKMGHQAAGLYRNRSRAAYWDGRNGRGESVASGVYFYTLTAGRFSATRKMLIMK